MATQFPIVVITGTDWETVRTERGYEVWKFTPTGIQKSVIGRYLYECTETGEPCEGDECQECCPHDERDHGFCLDCGHESNGTGY